MRDVNLVLNLRREDGVLNSTDSKFENIAAFEISTNLSYFIKFEFAAFALNLSPFDRVLRDCR